MKSVLLALLFLCTTSAFGFINIELVRKQTGEGFGGKSSLKASGQQGNTDKVSTNISTLNLYKQESDEILFLGDYNYSVTTGTTDTNNGQAHVRYTWGPDKAQSYESFVQTEFNQFRDLKTRDLVGGNIRQRVASSKKQSMFFGYGMFYEYDDWTTMSRWQGVRGNLYLSYVDIINTNVSGSATVYVQPALEAINNFRLQFQSELEVAMSSTLSVQLQLSINHESQNPAGVFPTDISYLAGFSYKY